MKKFDIWIEGYLTSDMEGIPENARLLAADVVGEGFLDAVKRWYDNEPDNVDRFGELIIHNGTASIWGCRLFDNETDARKSFG